MSRPEISGRTLVLGVVGDPVEHSLSPLLHNHVLNKLGLDYRYVAFHVRRELGGWISQAMQTFGLAGLNVTIPHKETVAGQMASLSEEADAVGAVNTIGWDSEGRLRGHNTDVAGFEGSLEARGLLDRLVGARAVVLGAGGASRAVLFALGRAGAAHITLVNRTHGRAEELSGWFGYRFPDIPVDILSPDTEGELEDLLPSAAITVNVTPLGMGEHRGESPLPDGVLPPAGSIVYDTIYSPRLTRLLADAEKAGCETVGGLDMLIIQGMESLGWWLGREVDWRGMLEELRELLGKRLEEG